VDEFRNKVWDYYRSYGRDLAWRHDPTPYEVLVTELMLQQTQVARVMERYPRWMKRFPSFEDLANASVAEVLEEWQGMGYNRRALYLHRIATAVVGEYRGVLPSDPAELVKLPGVGANTAGSVAAFAFNAPVVFIETNIRRVFLHEFFTDMDDVSDKELMPLIAEALDQEHPREWYYALMDYGSYLAKTVSNPNRRSKHHVIQSKFEGSTRQIRGEILRQLMKGPKAKFAITDARLSGVLSALEKEGFIYHVAGLYSLVR
jgi:A/G-specific adenine glycosylase